MTLNNLDDIQKVYYTLKNQFDKIGVSYKISDDQLLQYQIQIANSKKQGDQYYLEKFQEISQKMILSGVESYNSNITKIFNNFNNLVNIINKEIDVINKQERLLDVEMINVMKEFKALLKVEAFDMVVIQTKINNITAQIEMVRENFKVLTKTKDLISWMVDQYKNQIKEQQQKQKEQQIQHQNLEQELQLNKETLEKDQQYLNQINNEKLQLEQQNKLLNDELNAQQSNIDKLQQDIKNMKLGDERVQRKIVEQLGVIDQEQDKQKHMQQEIDDITQKIIHNQTLIDNNEKQIELEDKITILNQKSNELMVQLEVLEKQQSEVNTKLVDISKESNKLKTDIQQTEIKNIRLEAELKRNLQNLKQLEKQKSESNTTILDNTNYLDQLRQKIKNTQDSIQTSTNDLYNIKKELDQMEIEQTDLMKTYQDLKNQMEQLINYLNVLKKDKHQLEEEKGKYEGQIKNQLNINKLSEQQIKNLQEQITQQDKNNKIIVEEKKYLDQQYNELLDKQNQQKLSIHNLEIQDQKLQDENQNQQQSNKQLLEKITRLKNYDSELNFIKDNNNKLQVQKEELVKQNLELQQQVDEIKKSIITEKRQLLLQQKQLQRDIKQLTKILEQKQIQSNNLNTKNDQLSNELDIDNDKDVNKQLIVKLNQLADQIKQSDELLQKISHNNLNLLQIKEKQDKYIIKTIEFLIKTINSIQKITVDNKDLQDIQNNLVKYEQELISGQNNIKSDGPYISQEQILTIGSHILNNINLLIDHFQQSQNNIFTLIDQFSDKMQLLNSYKKDNTKTETLSSKLNLLEVMLTQYYSTDDLRYTYENIKDKGTVIELINRLLNNQTNIVQSYLQEFLQIKSHSNQLQRNINILTQSQDKLTIKLNGTDKEEIQKFIIQAKEIKRQMKKHQMTLFKHFYELFSIFIIPISRFKAKEREIRQAATNYFGKKINSIQEKITQYQKLHLDTTNLKQKQLMYANILNYTQQDTNTPKINQPELDQVFNQTIEHHQFISTINKNYINSSEGRLGTKARFYEKYKLLTDANEYFKKIEKLDILNYYPKELKELYIVTKDNIKIAMDNIFNNQKKGTDDQHERLWEGIAENMFSLSIPTYEYSQFITYIFLDDFLTNPNKSGSLLFGDEFQQQMIEYSKILKQRKEQRQVEKDVIIYDYPYNDDYSAFITSLEKFVSKKITISESSGKLMNVLSSMLNNQGIRETQLLSKGVQSLKEFENTSSQLINKLESIVQGNTSGILQAKGLKLHIKNNGDINFKQLQEFNSILDTIKQTHICP